MFWSLNHSGSPPRMRGKERAGLHAGRHPRITPAYAGKRIKLRKRHSICGDHPRVCGEKFSSVMRQTSRRGSPPRVRGKELHPVCVGGTHGITPACAGKSFRDNLVSRQLQDHPCVCGEKFIISCVVVTPMGSPPRMRGKVLLPAGVSSGLGITPARAGKRRRYPGPEHRRQDHPRACGEKEQHQH